jgi:GNAT superfamily N-acetyltransferase
MTQIDADRLLELATADTFWLPDFVQVVQAPGFKYTHSDRLVRIYNRVLYSHGELSDHERVLKQFLQTQREQTPCNWALTSKHDTDALRDLLTERGFSCGDAHYVQTLRCEDYDRSIPEDVQVLEVDSLERLRLLYKIQDVAFGRVRGVAESELVGELDACTRQDRRVIRYVAMRGGEPAGTGGMTMFPDLGFGLIWAGGVLPEQRGHGVYTALIAARVRDALLHGIHTIGLYAKVETSAPIVAAQGFERHGMMTYFERN